MFLTALLSYDSQSTKSTDLNIQFQYTKHKIHQFKHTVFRIFTELCVNHHNQILEHFYYPKKKPCTQYQQVHIPPPTPVLSNHYFVSMICLLGTFNTNGVIQYVVLGDWLISLNIAPLSEYPKGRKLVAATRNGGVTTFPHAIFIRPTL